MSLNAAYVRPLETPWIWFGGTAAVRNRSMPFGFPTLYWFTRFCAAAPQPPVAAPFQASSQSIWSLTSNDDENDQGRQLPTSNICHHDGRLPSAAATLRMTSMPDNWLTPEG